MSIQETFYREAYVSLHRKVMSVLSELQRNTEYRHPAWIQNPALPIPECITYRDKRVVQYLADGLSAKAIAEKEDKNPRTIETWINTLHKKTGISHTPQLVAFFFRNGWIK